MQVRGEFMKKEKVERKLTLEEYQQKSSNFENVKVARSFVTMFTIALGVIVATALFFVVLRLFDIHEIAGYAGVVGAVLVFIFAYLVPIIKLKNTKSFLTVVDATNAREAKRYNKALREEIADKMIDLSLKTKDTSWYSKENIDNLIIARQKRDNNGLKMVLQNIYDKDVKNASKVIIRKSAVQVGVATATCCKYT